MEISRRSFLVRAAALASLGGLELFPDAASGALAHAVGDGATIKLSPTALRGYGTISAVSRVLPDGHSSVTHITCESAAKALLTQAKYLSDLERLPGVEKGSLSLGSHAIPSYHTATGGAVACYTHQHDVLILAATDKRALATLCHHVLPALAQALEFTPRVSVPMYLDRWDKYGLICYFSPETTPPGVSERDYDYAEGLKFAQNNGPLGLIVWTNPLMDDYAEGLTNEQAWGWVQENARKMGVPMHINTQFSPPQVWLANRYREQTMLKAPQFLGGYYGVAHDTAGVGAISWLSEEAEDIQLGLSQEIVRRFAGDPNIVGWLEPHGETYEVPQKYFLDSGPYAEEVLRGFLRRRYGTLRALSKRWQGDAGHYKSWSEVHLPEIAEFAGFGSGAIDLRGVWRVRYLPAPDGHAYTQAEARGLPSPPPTAPVPPDWYRSGFDDSGWDELIAPGNDRMLAMTRSPLVYRRTIDISAEWLASQPQITLYIWDMVNHASDATVVYVNGNLVAEHAQRANDQHWSRFEVTSALRPGPNLLVLQMPRAIICYRAYLTQEPPRQYPHLGPQKNAQWVDFVEWNIESRGAQIRRGAEMIRQVDPNSSINFMAADDYFEPVKAICRDYGGRFHDTGAMAGFWTEENTLMMSGAGLPVTAEPGNGAPNVRDFQLFWGRWLTEGVNGVHYFQNLGDITWNPEILKVFEANRAMYEAVGKYHTPAARVACLFSLLSGSLTGFPWSQDPTGGYYSPYNSAGQLINYCPRDGIGAADFGTPLVDKYRVIIDTNTVCMSEELLSGIEKFVRRGGIFITYGETGRHSLIQPDAWPISKLSGYEVTQEYGWNDGRSVSFASNQTVFGPSDLSPAMRAVGLGLKAIAPECRTLAAWDDGAAAIGLRPLGAGWIVHLGPLFQDERFVAVTGALLRHFGVTDRVPATVAPKPGLHLRHFLGNTGLHDVWVLFNESDTPLTTDLIFLPGVHPASLTDIVSGQKTEVVRAAAGDSVSGIALGKWQTRMYLSPCADVAASPLEWLTLQHGWWQGTVKPPVKHLPTPKEMQRFSLDLTEGWACKSAAGLTDDQAAALAQSDLDDSHWERRRLELWLTPGDHSKKRLLLRRKLTVPSHWTAGPVMLCADIPGRQFWDETRLFLDGKSWNDGRKTVDGPYFDTLGGAFKPGTTHLLTLDIQSQTSLTGSQGPIWLYYLPDALESQALSGTWASYSDPLHKTGQVTLPGIAQGMYLSRTVVIDSRHQNRNVVIYYEAAGDRLSLLVNGSLFKRSEQFREHICVFNVTPMVKFGTENVIELAGNGGPGQNSVQRIEIRYYEKGAYP